MNLRLLLGIVYMEKHLFQVMILYSDPLSIQTTTVVKAVAYSSEDTPK